MEIRYFIKEVATATETNPSFAGMVEVDICGKNEECVYSDFLYHNRDLTDNPICMREYGYRSKSRAITEATKQAKESREYDIKYGYWEYKFYVVEYTIDDNGDVTLTDEVEVVI